VLAMAIFSHRARRSEFLIPDTGDGIGISEIFIDVILL